MALSAQAKGMQTTQGEDLVTTEALVPALNNAGQLDRVLGLLAQVPAHAEVVVGGRRQGDRGFYVEPTVVVGVEQSDTLRSAGDLRTGDHGPALLG